MDDDYKGTYFFGSKGLFLEAKSLRKCTKPRVRNDFLSLIYLKKDKGKK